MDFKLIHLILDEECAFSHALENVWGMGYLEKVGAIMHHNADKSLLVAGEVETRFGGGTMKEPMLLIFGDGAIFNADEVEMPVVDIAN